MVIPLLGVVGVGLADVDGVELVGVSGVRPQFRSTQ